MLILLLIFSFPFFFVGPVCSPVRSGQWDPGIQKIRHVLTWSYDGMRCIVLIFLFHSVHMWHDC